MCLPATNFPLWYSIPKKKKSRYYSNFVKWLAHVYLLEAILPQRAEVPVIPQKMAKWRGAMYGPCLEDW